MTGRLGESGLGDEGVYGGLIFSRMPGACKAECPVGVDMARFKSEFLADYRRATEHRYMRGLLGGAHELAKWGSHLASLANATAAFGPVRSLNERLFGIDRRRTLPVWSRRTFTQLAAGSGSANPDVLVFKDTFTNYYEPEIGMAALDVLTAAGLRVRWLRMSAAAAPSFLKDSCGARGNVLVKTWKGFIR